MSRFAPPLRGLVLDIDRFSTHDGPGIRTTVFLKGCSLRCSWCHSPESQQFIPELLYMENKCTACGLCFAACPKAALSPVEFSRDRDGLLGNNFPSCQVVVDRARCDGCGACAEVCYPGALRLVGEWWEVDALVEEVAKDAIFFQYSGGGVTLSGGEASQQGDFAIAFLEACKKYHLATAVETSGVAAWHVIQRLVEFTDLFLYDLKLMDDELHRKWTGSTNRLIHENLRHLAALGANVIVRVPCIPNLTDTTANITATAVFLQQLGLQRVHLLPYNPSAGAKYAWLDRSYDHPEWIPQDASTMQALAGICQSYGLSVSIGG